MPDTTASRTITLVNPQGFHARPAHKFMQLASGFQAEVLIIKGNEKINGKSILDLFTLGAQNGTTLTLQANGHDAQAAVDALAQLVENGFGEMAEQ
jgi:phosphocarrier protein HPr